MGTAIFALFAAGAPLGTALFDRGGFVAVALATAVLPLAMLGVAVLVQGAVPARMGSPGFLSVVGRIWLPGLAAALSSIGFGALITLSAILFSACQWEPVWLAFTAYAVALLPARLHFWHLPDRLGGARVALLCAIIETVGLIAVVVALAARRRPARGGSRPLLRIRAALMNKQTLGKSGLEALATEIQTRTNFVSLRDGAKLLGRLQLVGIRDFLRKRQ